MFENGWSQLILIHQIDLQLCESQTFPEKLPTKEDVNKYIKLNSNEEN